MNSRPLPARCLICSLVNPCKHHSAEAQFAVLRREHQALDHPVTPEPEPINNTIQVAACPICGQLPQMSASETHAVGGRNRLLARFICEGSQDGHIIAPGWIEAFLGENLNSLRLAQAAAETWNQIIGKSGRQ